MSRHPRRWQVISAALALAVLGGALALWIPGGQDRPSPDAGGQPAAAQTRPPAELRVTFSSGEDAPRTATIRCGDGAPKATGAWASDPRRACRAVYAAAPALLDDLPPDPAPAGAVCAERFFGDQRLSVSGTIGSQRVQRTFARTDTCQEELFEAVRVLADPWFPVERPEAEPSPPVSVP